MIKLTMECLIILWFCIDMAIFLLLLSPLRKKIVVFDNTFHQRAIEKKESWRSKLFNSDVPFAVFALLGMLGLIVVCFLSNEALAICLGIHNAIFMVALFPLICGEFGTNKNSLWKWIFVISAAVFGVLGYFYAEQIKAEESMSDNFWIIVRVSLVAFVTALLMVIVESVYIKMIDNRNRSKHKPRTDLFFRTPKLTENISDKFDLIRFCEILFGDYCNCYAKLNEIDSIVYVNLSSIQRERWYLKAAEKMKWCWAISLQLACLFFEEYGMILLVILLLYIVIIYIYKKIDSAKLQVIGLRYFYDDWGYCLVSMEEEHFVGEVQLVERTRYHKYVHSFLDIAALCRAVAVKDMVEKTKDIQLVSQYLGSLFIDWRDEDKESDWVKIIPLWIVALFEYEVTGDIASSLKEQISRTICKENKEKIHMFILSFWCDMKRKKPNEGIVEFVGEFEKRFKELER